MSARTITLLDAVSTTGLGSAVELDVPPGTEVPYETIHTGTATSNVHGSLDGTTYYALFTAAAAGIGTFKAPRYVKGNCESRSSGTITVKILSKQKISRS